MLWTNELVIAALSHKLLSVLYRYTLIALAYSLTSQVVSLAISVYSGPDFITFLRHHIAQIENQ